MTFAVIDEQPVGTAPRCDDQVETAITINVHERRPDGMLSRTRDACARRDVLKMPVAQVTIQHIRPVNGTKIKVAQTVAIHVAGREAAGNQGGTRSKTPHGIGEGDASLGWWHQGKTGR